MQHIGPSDPVACHTIDGRTVLVSRERLTFRPGAYGIVTWEDKLLLMRNKNTLAFELPGGGVDIGEPLQTALRREVMEETGISVKPEQLAFFAEEFFYYEPNDEAFHSLRFFYECRPLTVDLIKDHLVQDDESIQPRWIDIGPLTAQQFQGHGQTLLDYLRNRHTAS